MHINANNYPDFSKKNHLQILKVALTVLLHKKSISIIIKNPLQILNMALTGLLLIVGLSAAVADLCPEPVQFSKNRSYVVDAVLNNIFHRLISYYVFDLLFSNIIGDSERWNLWQKVGELLQRPGSDLIY